MLLPVLGKCIVGRIMHGGMIHRQVKIFLLHEFSKFFKIPNHISHIWVNYSQIFLKSMQPWILNQRFPTIFYSILYWNSNISKLIQTVEKELSNFISHILQRFNHFPYFRQLFMLEMKLEKLLLIQIKRFIFISAMNIKITLMFLIWKHLIFQR